jgi:hypothetical protein
VREVYQIGRRNPGIPGHRILFADVPRLQNGIFLAARDGVTERDQPGMQPGPFTIIAKRIVVEAPAK